MRKAVLIAFLCAVARIGAQSPADGNWAFTLSSPMGVVEAKVQMKSDGETLTGTFTVNGAEWPIEEGTIKGDEVAFVLNRPGAAMSYAMKGTVKGDTVTGTAHAMGATVDWSMARAQ